MCMPVPERRVSRGFTLIECVIGIVLLSIAMILLVGTFLPMMNYQSQPIYQVRAAALGHSMLDEALSRSFDENSDRSGGTRNLRYCGTAGSGEESAGPCTVPSAYGLDAAEGTSRNFTLYNDVDDFDNFCAGKSGRSALSGDEIASLLGLDTSLYSQYRVTICVTSAPEWLGLSSRDDVAKKVVVSVITPAGDSLSFVAYRSNY